LETAGKLTENKMLDAEHKNKHFTISLNTRGEGVMVSELPWSWVNKLKDRFLDKCDQFDPGERNIVGIDVTSMAGTFEAYCDTMMKIFETGSSDLISCAFLFDVTFMLESDEVRSRTGFRLVPNPLARNGHDVKTALSGLLLKGT
jgi:hypothetical protein